MSARVGAGVPTWAWLLGGAGALLLLGRAKASSDQEWSGGEAGGETGPAGTVDFPFMDERYLASGQSNGGRVEVPDARGALPLLVYLHGNNDSGVLHRAMGGAPGDNDVRTMAPAGWMVAAPSQTRGAKGQSLWAGFDLDAFVAAVEAAAGRTVDRSRVVLSGHSGAGCTTGGGLLGKLGSVVPAKVVVIDVCMTPVYGSLYAALGALVPVEVYYQPFTWARDYAGFTRAFGTRGKVVQIDGPFTGNAHEQIVPLALGQALSGW